MFFNTLPPKARTVFRRLGQTPEVTNFYLAGGSALALQLGHRISVDLDFFTLQDFNAESLTEQVRKIGKLVIEQQGRGNLIGYLNDTHLSFFWYRLSVADANG